MNTPMKTLATPLVAVASALALAACGAPATEDETAADETSIADEASEAGTVVAVAQGNEAFSTLVTAVSAADLVDTLSGEGPFTVFAPTNDAFAKLPEGTVEGLLEADAKEQLSSILTYHVVAGATDAATLTSAIESNDGSFEITTVNGGSLTATVDGENVVLTDAAGGTAIVTDTDVAASNGVIHIIDTVLMPG